MVRKEISAVIRQPRLILTLILGPFLIVLVFGVGYRSQPAPYRTVVVLESQEAGLAADPERLSDAFGESIELVGVTTDPEEAREQLQADEIDLAIIAPGDPLATLETGEKAMFTVLHREVDPTIGSNITLLARISVDQINRLVLEEVASRAQEQSEDVEDPIAAIEASADSLATALESGDDQAAERARDDLQDQLRALDGGLDGGTGTGGVYSGIAAALGAGGGQDAGLARLRAALDEPGSDAASQAREVEDAVQELRQSLDTAQGLDPALLVSPFGVDVEQIAPAPPSSPSIFYVPGTLVLLVQHLGVTFAALSLVRERQLGLTDLYRVSPLTVTEALTGKYLAFLLMAGAVAAILSGTMLLFGVPAPASIWEYVAILVLVILASLGLGFIVSAISRTDSQAVQYSMTILLVSIFFTGFVLPLQQLIAPVQVVSYLIPATYGVAALRDLLFGGTSPDALVLAGLAAYTVLLAIASWWAVRKDVT
jgi:ABC-2 type transport system permease protein